MNNEDFDSDFDEGLETASFAVSNSDECRFIRLTQTSKNNSGRHNLAITGFAFFGTVLLRERRE
jgi:hypothetical protein